LPPVLWSHEHGQNKLDSWGDETELFDTIKNHLDIATIGRGVDAIRITTSASLLQQGRTFDHKLPPELWSLILDLTGDWELAQALHVYTALPTPSEWCRLSGQTAPQGFDQKLEWTLLTGTLQDVQQVFDPHLHPTYLSRLAIRVIMRSH